MASVEAMAAGSASFAVIAAATWYIASRPRLFVRAFVPQDELWSAGRQVLRRGRFRRGVRLMAGLQLGLACVLAVAWLWLRR